MFLYKGVFYKLVALIWPTKKPMVTTSRMKWDGDHSSLFALVVHTVHVVASRKNDSDGG